MDNISRGSYLKIILAYFWQFHSQINEGLIALSIQIVLDLQMNKLLT